MPYTIINEPLQGARPLFIFSDPRWSLLGAKTRKIMEEIGVGNYYQEFGGSYWLIVDCDKPATFINVFKKCLFENPSLVLIHIYNESICDDSDLREQKHARNIKEVLGIYTLDEILGPHIPSTVKVIFHNKM